MDFDQTWMEWSFYGLLCKLFKDRIKNEALIVIYDIATPFCRTVMMSLSNIKFIQNEYFMEIFLFYHEMYVGCTH